MCVYVSVCDCARDCIYVSLRVSTPSAAMILATLSLSLSCLSPHALLAWLSSSFSFLSLASGWRLPLSYSFRGCSFSFASFSLVGLSLSLYILSLISLFLPFFLCCFWLNIGFPLSPLQPGSPADFGISDQRFLLTLSADLDMETEAKQGGVKRKTEEDSGEL